jgi:hypothetical protein
LDCQTTLRVKGVSPGDFCTLYGSRRFVIESPAMHIDLLFSGFAGVVVGAFITTLISYLFQRRLLDKQLAAADKSQKVFADFLTEFRNMLNDRLGMMTAEMIKQNARIMGQPR